MTDDIVIPGSSQEVLRQLGDREPTTRIQARAITENIRNGKGYLDDELRSDLQNLPPRSRDRILQNFEERRALEAAYTTTISKGLYSTKYRFLYELIQNADDAFHQTADPEAYILFRITPGKLEVETNENGFKRADVNAICETGQSSKTDSVDQTGEKGFGFKSVFAISHHVRVRSGHWSFQFEHCPGEDGIGMVTPLDAPYETLPDGVGTRITLRLTDRTPSSYHRLVAAFSDIPETTVLFLRFLQKIKVHITHSDGQTEQFTITKGASVNGCTKVKKIVTALDGKVQNHKTSYFRYTHAKRDMPEDERRQGVSRADIELAFPIDMASRKPRLSPRGQHIFAYLPIQRVAQLPFLVQSDFITAANRESVEWDCEWNEAICEAVAEAFCDAVDRHFVRNNHFLQYTWLDYVPTSPMEQPWTSLYGRIIERLQAKTILRSWKKKTFCYPKQLRHMREDFYLHQGEPILEDLQPEGYLAPYYNVKYDATILRDLGVQELSASDIVKRVQADIVLGSSKIKSTESNGAWHESLAGLLLHVYESKSASAISTLEMLAIIPLRNGVSWTGALRRGGENVYFPTVGSTLIPASIPLKLLRPDAATGKRKTLYAKMGVKHCSPEMVNKKIEEAHKSSLVKSHTIGNVKAHLQFLFHHHTSPEQIKDWIHVPTIGGGIHQASSIPLYVPSRDEFDLYQLLENDAICSSVASFLVASIYKPITPDIRIRGLTWQAWLREITGAKRIPSLIERKTYDTPKISQALLAVLEFHPAKFLATLRAHWDLYQGTYEEIKKELSQCEVPCVSGDCHPLKDTILPTPSIASAIVKLGLSPDKFPLLTLPGKTLDETTTKSWMFIKDLRVTVEPNIQFYKMVLEILQGQDDTETIENAVVVSIYESMAGLISLSDGKDIRTFFEVFDSVWDPSQAEWSCPSRCRWQGPDFMTAVPILARTYGKCTLLENFFKVILEVKDTSIDDVVEEIEDRQMYSSSEQTTDILGQIFTHIENTLSERGWVSLRTEFSNKKLILGHDTNWYTLDKCVWNPVFPLAGYLDVSIAYPTLKTFFVQRLGVIMVTPTMLIHEIEKIAKGPDSNADDIHQRLINIGMQLTRTSINFREAKALDALKELAFLPRKTGRKTTLVKPVDTFAIPDHPRYGEAFKGHDVLLDFTTEEVSILNVIFKHMHLTERYLSVSVEEVSVTGEDSTMNPVLSKTIQSRAFALYCCAAKYKSTRALRGCTKLFDQLSSAQMFTTEKLSTSLVLFPKSPNELTVASDRIFIHHEVQEDSLHIFVPTEEKERHSCYRSQLPKLLAYILGIGPTSLADIVMIMNSKPEDLDEVLAEQDIPEVAWIEKPIIEVVPESVGRPKSPATASTRLTDTLRRAETTFSSTEPSTPPTRRVYSAGITGVSEYGSGGAQSYEPRTPTPRSSGLRMGSALFNASAGLYTPDSAGPRSRHSPRGLSQDGGHASIHDLELLRRSRYSDFIDEIINSAQLRAADGSLQPSHLFSSDEPATFDHIAVFGDRVINQFVHDKRVGAAGEAFVYELFESLEIPSFGYENWQSTIRHEVKVNPRFSDLVEWSGRETADMVYTDRVGTLTKWLREECTGAFPSQISPGRNFATQPIQYYLEVKSTTTACNTRFFVSRRQQRRIEEMTLNTDAPPDKVYVLLRVYNMACPEDTGLKVYVDPWNLKGKNLTFEVEQWIGKTMWC